MYVANVFAVFVFVLILVFFPRLPGRKIGSCFMSLRRLSCGLIASSVSATNWSWRPSIISSTFPSFPLKDRIFWNTTRETAKANIRLVWNWFDSSREKTLVDTWGEDTHSNRVMVAYFSRPLVTNIAPVNINSAKAIPMQCTLSSPRSPSCLLSPFLVDLMRIVQRAGTSVQPSVHSAVP